jgi:hypothetical protein
MLTDIQDAEPVSATSLGFGTPDPGEPSVPALPKLAALVASLPQEDAEEFLTKFLQRKALLNVHLLTDQLTETMMLPETSVRAKMDFLDSQYKMSGAAARQAAKEAVVGAQFSIQINIPQVGASAASSRIIEGTAHEEVRLPEVLGGLLDQRQVHKSGGGPGRIDEDDDFDN